MVRMKMYKEREIIVHHYDLYIEEKERNSLYLVNDEVSVWVDFFENIDDLTRIASRDIRELIFGAASGIEYDSLMWDIEDKGGYDDFRGNFIKLI